MANPTTYFGWVMPTATDLVTDLPADFAVFGQGVDTSMQDLLGGTTGQVLAKNSATNMDFTWTTPSAGGMTLLNSGGTTLSGASTSISITVTGYTSLTIYIKDAYATVDDVTATMRINGDSGSNYASNIIRYEGNSVSGVQNSATTSIGNIFQQLPSSNTVLYKGNAKIDIFQPTATDNFGIIWQGMSAKNSGVTASIVGTANYNASAAITAVSFFPSSGNWSGGTVYVYGVK
jgi:hypothetical protein